MVLLYTPDPGEVQLVNLPILSIMPLMASVQAFSLFGKPRAINDPMTSSAVASFSGLSFLLLYLDLGLGGIGGSMGLGLGSRKLIRSWTVGPGCSRKYFLNVSNTLHVSIPASGPS